MQAKTEITKAIFGFKDKETGEQLRAFFKKHTGRDVDFNSIKHYTSGFKLLVFSIPLNTVDIIGITAAGCAPHYVKRFCGLNDFIEWYENIYKKGIKEEPIINRRIFKTKHNLPLDYSFVERYRKLNLNLEIEFDPFPFIDKYTPIEPPKRCEDTATIVLYNGLNTRVPMKSFSKYSLVLNTNIFLNQKERDWNDFLHYLGISESESGRNIIRYTPDDKQIIYDEKYDDDVELICNYINYCFNKENTIEYPKEWFEVIKLLLPRKGGPLGRNGDVIAASMFAAPRSYLKYFSNNRSINEIADAIFYDYF